MSLLILTTGIDNQPLTQAFREADPKLDIQIGPDAKNLESVRFALVWKQPPGSLANLKNLEIIFSLGAGVDHLLKDPHFPDLPVVRFVDPDLTQRMVEYVVLHVLAHHRYLRDYNTFQDNLDWKELPKPWHPRSMWVSWGWANWAEIRLVLYVIWGSIYWVGAVYPKTLKTSSAFPGRMS